MVPPYDLGITLIINFLTKFIVILHKNNSAQKKNKNNHVILWQKLYKKKVFSSLCIQYWKYCEDTKSQKTRIFSPFK